MRIALRLSCLAVIAAAVCAGDAAPSGGEAPVGDAPVLGEGGHRYRWVAGWAKLPDNVKLAPTHGCVAVDGQDRIYVNTDNENPILVFNADGSFIKVIGQQVKGGAHGMTIVKEGDKEVLWLASLGRSEVIKMNLDGEVLLTIPWPEKSGIYKSAKEYKVTSVAVAPNGDVYAADGYGKGYVHRFTATGEYVSSWNASAGKAGKFNTPHGVAVDTRGATPQIIVADRENGRLQYFTMEGEYLDVLTGFNRPCKVVVRDGDLVVPELKGRVTIVTAEKRLIHLGENSDPKLRANFGVPVAQWKDGEFIAPHGAAWDSQGNLYVEDWNKTGRVSKLARIR